MLDRKTHKLLVYISKHENITDDEIKEHFHAEMLSEIDVLYKNKYISFIVTEFEFIDKYPIFPKRSYKITPEGRAYLEKTERSIMFTIITVAISAFMLLINILNRYD